MPSDPFQNPTAIITQIRTTPVQGGTAGNLTLAGITTDDRVISVHSMNYTTGACADLTSEFSIASDDTINNTGGTATTGAIVLVVWYDRYGYGDESDAAWNV